MAKPTEEHHRRIAEMTFSELYPLYLAKVVRKNRTKEELHAVLNWLTGFSDEELQKQMDQGNTLATFFAESKFNPLSIHVKGVICGYRIEELENGLTRQARILDKLVDELAKGRALDRVLRSGV